MNDTAPPAHHPLIRRGLPPAALVLLLAALTGCNGSRFGDTLSRSFSTPTPTSPAANPSGSGGATSGTKPAPASASGSTTPSPSGTARPAGSSPSAAAASPASNGSPASRSTTSAGTTPPATATAAAAPNGQPGASGRGSASPAGNPVRSAPYRVTILLPQADAAAPAEVVTQALRAAGVPFEVETIERQGRGAAPEAPVSRPAPAPR